MGLDNFPYKYPCKTKGTAVITPRLGVDGNVIIDPETGEEMTGIDCQATQACGGCPYKTALDKADGLGTPVYGMFGTDCWYRGKYGNYLLEEVSISDPMGDNMSFYGDNEDGTEKSPASCVALADLIATAIKDYTEEDLMDSEVAETVAGLKYAEWYLRWAAEQADGLVCWY